MLFENIVGFVKVYGPYVGAAIAMVALYVFDKNKATVLLKEMMLAAARLLRKGVLENTNEMKAWVVDKYDALPAYIKLVISKDAWSKMIDYIAEKIKDYCDEDVE